MLKSAKWALLGMVVLSATSLWASPFAWLSTQAGAPAVRITIPPPPSNNCPVNVTCTYFAQSGSDISGNGTIGNPYQTMAKLMNLLHSAPAGAQFLLNRGDTWHEMISLGNPQTGPATGTITNGTTAAPITISNYGSGSLPLLDELNANPFCVNAYLPSVTVNNMTIDGLECTHAWAMGVALESPTAGQLQGMTVSNMDIHNTGPGAAHTTGVAVANQDGYDDWLTPHTYIAYNSCTPSSPDSSCGYIMPSTNNASHYIFQETVASCHSGSSAPAFPSSVGGAITESSGSPACRWVNTGQKRSAVPGSYENQLQGFGAGATGLIFNFHFIGNSIHSCGGHNCFEIDGDNGQPLEMNNTIGPGCEHVCMDNKESGNYAAAGTTAVPGTTQVFPGNVAVMLNNVVRCGYSLGVCGGKPRNSGSDSYYMQNAKGNNTDVLIEGNVAWDFGANSGGNTSGWSGTPNAPPCGANDCSIVARLYNNTFYCAPGVVGGQFPIYFNSGKGTGTALHNHIDIRNNILDGCHNNSISVGAILASGTTGGVANTEAYNNIGGSQGSAGFTFNGSTTKGTGDWCASGCGTRTSLDPNYVSAATGDFRLNSGSPMLGVGTDLSNGNNNIGYYSATGQ